MSSALSEIISEVDSPTPRGKRFYLSPSLADMDEAVFVTSLTSAFIYAPIHIFPSVQGPREAVRLKADSCQMLCLKLSRSKGYGAQPKTPLSFLGLALKSGDVMRSVDRCWGHWKAKTSGRRCPPPYFRQWGLYLTVLVYKRLP